MAADFLHWFVVGFAAGLGWALAHWICSKILR